MHSNKSLERRILELVERPDYKPTKPRLIAESLDLPGDDLRDVKRALKQLVKSGKVTFGPKHIVLRAAQKRKHNELIGRYRRAAAGYGFVSVAPSDADGFAGQPVEDVYIPQRKSLDAADGDMVRIRVSTRRQGQRMRTSGRVLEVIERRTHQFVGTYHERGELGLVTVDGNEFDGDIMVGDAGAKNVRIGDKVVIEMVRFPGAHHHRSHHQAGEGVIVEVLGERGKPGVDTLTIIRQFGLPGDFNQDVLDDARRQAESFDETIDDGRVDFTGETIVTIDPREARDFDDAISLKRIENGHWQLGVHIADVSHFVRPNSALDNEAYYRGTSVYLPDRVIPMLPEIVSNNLASLQPGRLRYTMTALIEFTAEGTPIGTELQRGAIKSAHRFNYEEIDDYLENDKPWRKKLSKDVFRLVGDMHQLAMVLRRRRLDRGALDLIIPEIEIDLDDHGKVSGAHVRSYTESHQIIEEFMLAANFAVAQHLVDLELHLLRRIHEPPSTTKLTDLKAILRDLGYRADNIQSRSELKRIIEKSRNQPESHAVHFAILRAMQKAIYSPRDVGHYALASEAYCHFTSPIRRYPDLIIHRMVGSLIDGQRPAAEFGMLTRLGEHCSDLEQRAEQAERELVKLKLINFLSERIGMEMDAVISGVESYGLFALGIELPANGLIPLECLPRDHYYYDRGTRTLMGHRSGNTFRLGNRVRVRVVLADPDRREIEFELVATKPKEKKTRQGDDKKSKNTSSVRRGSSRAPSKRGQSKSSPTAARKRKATGHDRPRKHK